MPTVREDIAQIRRSVNSINPDGRFSNKFLYDKMMDVTKMIVRRDTEQRRIFKSTELFKSIFCIPMEAKPIESCTNIYIPKCSTLYVSKIKLPKAFLTPTGSILSVFNVDRSVKLTPTTPQQYSRIVSREAKGPELYYWIENDYIYTPQRIDEVLVFGMFLSSAEVDRINAPTLCHRFLDGDSVIPDWLRVDVIRVVVQDIAGVTKRIPQDENVNNNSGN